MRLRILLSVCSNLYYYLLEIPHCFVRLVESLIDFQDYCGFIFMCIVLLTFQWELGRRKTKCVHSFNNLNQNCLFSFNPVSHPDSYCVLQFSLVPNISSLSTLALLQDFFPSGSDRSLGILSVYGKLLNSCKMYSYEFIWCCSIQSFSLKLQF